MTVEEVEWFWECGCSLSEIAEWFDMPESHIKQIVWNLIGCGKRAA